MAIVGPAPATSATAEPRPWPDADAGAGAGELLAAAQAGAPWALGALFRQVQPGLLRYLRAREPRLAEDLASEVWIDVAAALGRFHGTESGFRAWIYTIARRRLIDARRQAGRRRTEPVSHDRFSDRPAPDDPEAAVVASMGAQAAVDLIVAVLTEDQADVVLMRVLGGLQVAEVAEVLGKQPTAVRVTQHRALRRLAEHFSVGDEA